MYNKELDRIVRNKTELLHKHIEVLKKQLDEREDAIKKLREELNRPSTTKWVEAND
jgi:chaperonin cofactor prefoldin